MLYSTDPRFQSKLRLNKPDFIKPYLNTSSVFQAWAEPELVTISRWACNSAFNSFQILGSVEPDIGYTNGAYNQEPRLVLC